MKSFAPLRLLCLTAALAAWSVIANAACTGPSGPEGSLNYDTSAHAFKFCDNNDVWQDLGASGGANGDRITSGTTSLVAVSNTGFISLTQAGTNTGWFDPTRGLVTIGVSSTGGISGTTGYFSGNVGIGTATPAATLDVVAGTGSPIIMRPWSGQALVVSNSNAPARITLVNANANYNIGADVDGKLKFARSGPFGQDPYTAMTILNTSNVGVGTQTPTAVLQVSGSFIVSTSAQNTTPTLSAGANGRVGIGTNAPAYALDVAGNANFRGNGTNLMINDGGAITDTNYMQVTNNRAMFGYDPTGGAYAVVQGAGGKGIEFNVSSSIFGSGTAAVILPGGNFGISTLNPTTKLEVYGTVSATNFVGDGTGITGINTTTDRITSGTTNITAFNNGAISFTTAGGYRMTLSSAGNLGIGTNTPSDKLEIVGTSEWMSRLVSSRVSGRNHFIALRSSGTDAVTNGMTLGGLAMGGYDGSNYSFGWNGGAEITALAAENFTPTTRGTDLSLRTTPIGTAGASERMRILANGNVGIGTAAPAAPLEVTSSLAPIARFGAGNGRRFDLTVGAASLDFYGTAGSTAGDVFHINRSTAGHHIVLNAGGLGRVGIGTTSLTIPSATLHVSGTTRIESWTTIAANAAPSVALDVYGTVSATNFVGNGSGLTGVVAGSADRITSGTTNIIANNGTSITFTTAGTQRMIMDTVGRVGIGTVWPSNTFHVSGTARVTDLTFSSRGSFTSGANASDLLYNGNRNVLLDLGNSGGVSINNLSPTATLQVSGSFIVSTSAQITTPSLYVGTNGNVGIGTSSPAIEFAVARGDTGAARLHLQNSTTGYTATDGLQLGVYSGNAYVWNYENTPLLLGTNNVERIRITSSGNVGVSTSVPSATLHVVGTISTTDAIQVGASSLACSSGIPGAIRYNSSSNTLQICNSIGWVSLVSGTAGSSVVDLDDLLDVSSTVASGNLYLGWNAGTANAGGTGNTGVGISAISLTTTGSNNSALGRQSLQNNVTGSGNVAMGYLSLNTQMNTTNQVAIGHEALRYTSGTSADAALNNTAIGYRAMRGNASTPVSNTGDNNVAIGTQVMLTNEDGSSNVAVGNGALGGNLSGDGNVAVGALSLATNKTGSSNVAIGPSTLFRVGNGSSNVAIGNAAATNISGTQADPASNNIAIGLQALMGSGTYESNTADYNIAMGYQAMQNASSGQHNVGIGGFGTMRFISTGDSNVGIGSYALAGVGAGSSNVGIGQSAVAGSGSNNTGVGFAALANNVSGGNNAAFGYYSLNSHEISANQTAIGFQAMRNISGSNVDAATGNTAVGYNAMAGSGTAANNTADNNTVVGYNPIPGVTSGSSNTMVGYNGGNALTTGSSNIFIGAGNGATLTNGMHNIIIGTGINVPAAGSTGYLNIGNLLFGDLTSRGISATAISATTIQAGASTLSCGSGITGAIRYNSTSNTLQVCSSVGWVSLSSGTTAAIPVDRITSGTTSVTANGTNYISITNGGTVTGYFDTTGRLIVPGISVTTNQLSATAGYFSGNVGIGSSSPLAKLDVVGNVSVTGGVSLTGYVQATGYLHTSDIRLKNNVTTIGDALETLARLRGTHFTWKADGKPAFGLIAQEVEAVLPELVPPGEGLKTVDYDQLVPFLIEAVKELKADNDDLRFELKAANDNQEKAIKGLEDRIRRLEAGGRAR